MARVMPLALVLCVIASAEAGAGEATSSAARHAATPMRAGAGARAFTPDGMKWVDAPSLLPPGIRMFVMEGDPARPGPYTLRLWLPANCRIGPYWRFNPERLTVMLGVVILGMGDVYTEREGIAVHAGSFAVVPERTHHFVWTRDVAVVQLHGNGPWDIMYVRAGDDPRQATRPGHTRRR